MRVFSPEKLKERRKKFRLSQADLAEIAGLSTAYINYLEKGKQKPSAEVVGRLAWCLRVRESYFFVTKHGKTKKDELMDKEVKNGERLDG